MLNATKDKLLPTAIIGSLPRPTWYTENLRGRTFTEAMADSVYREQYVDAIDCQIGAQERAGLDIVTDGDSRFDLEVGGRSWFTYVSERIGGLGPVSTHSRWLDYQEVRPGHILRELDEVYRPPRVVAPVTPGPLQYTEVWKVAQRMTSRPVKLGAIASGSLIHLLWNEYYPTDHDLVMDLAKIMNREYRELADAGAEVIQVEEPPIHFGACTGSGSTPERLSEMVEEFNAEIAGVNTEIWAHTCWGNANQQAGFWHVPTYEKALPYLSELDADLVTFECSTTEGRDFPLLGQWETDKKIGIGVINHTITTVEPADVVADRIRKALEYIPVERLAVVTDCGFGREGLSRRIAFYKCVALVQGTNIVRRELGLPEAEVPAANEALALVGL